MSELQGLQSRIKDFHAMGYELAAVSPDSVADNRRVTGRMKLEFPILSDNEMELTDRLGLRHPGGAPDGSDIPRPATYIIHNKEIQWEFLTDNWRVRMPPKELVEVVRTLE